MSFANWQQDCTDARELSPRHARQLLRHRSERDDLRDSVEAIALHDIVDTVAPTKVDVKVRHGNPLGVQETFEQ